jgi:hypothetical protein
LDFKIEIEKDIFLTNFKKTDDFSEFDCGDKDINEFLKEDSIRHIVEDLARIYVVKDNNNKILAFASLSTSILEVGDSPDTKEDKGYNLLPAILLGRLGVDKKFLTKRYGIKLIDFCVGLAVGLKEYIGVRYIILDAYPDKVKYYRKNGFVTETKNEDIKKCIKKQRRGGKQCIPMYFRL